MKARYTAEKALWYREYFERSERVLLKLLLKRSKLLA
jgi:hypothetical protein